MKIKLKVEKEVDVKTLIVNAGVRYWEDTRVNGVEDTEGTLIPCRNGENWSPVIDIDSGKITNWTQGVIADIHYKVCDAGRYTLRDADGNDITEINGYVPSSMCPKESGYGDYIIMDVDENGVIADWQFNIEDFDNSEE
jgi:hypothetical protein